MNDRVRLMASSRRTGAAGSYLVSGRRRGWAPSVVVACVCTMLLGCGGGGDGAGDGSSADADAAIPPAPGAIDGGATGGMLAPDGAGLMPFPSGSGGEGIASPIGGSGGAGVGGGGSSGGGGAPAGGGGVGAGGRPPDAGMPVEIVRAASLTPPSTDYGDSPVMQAGATQILNLKNTGNSTLQDLRIEVEGTGAEAFIATGTGCQGALKPGTICAVTVQFFPKQMGSVTATLRIFSGNEALAVATITGRGVAAGELVVTPKQLDFEATTFGYGTRVAYVVTNPSATTVKVTASFLGDAAEFQNAFLPPPALPRFATCTALPPGQSCRGQVDFFAKSAGSKIATLKLDAGAAGSALVPLSAIALAGTAVVTPADFDFGQVVRGQDVVKSFSVTVSDLPLGQLAGPIDVVEPSGFKLENNTCKGRRIAVGEDCSFALRLRPVGEAYAGTHRGWIRGNFLVQTDWSYAIDVSVPPLTSYLLGRWTFNDTLAEATGTPATAVASSGMVVNAPPVEPVYSRGPTEYALNCSVTWARIKHFTRLDEISRNEEIAATMWVDTSSADLTRQVFVSLPRTGSDIPHFAFGEDAGKWHLAFDTDVFTSDRARSRGWHRLLVSRSRHWFRFYVDGELVIDQPTFASFAPPLDATPILVGATALANGAIVNRFNGSISDLRIYSRSFSDAEVKAELTP